MKKETAKTEISCRYCKGNHWTTKCPYKDQYDLKDSSSVAKEDSIDSKKYVPPSLRGGAAGKTTREGSEATVRITNLSEEVTDNDLRELIAKFGATQRVVTLSYSN